MASPLASIYRECRLEDEETWRKNEELEPALRSYIDAARAGWPDLPIEDVDFVRYVGTRAPRGALPPLTHAQDLFLACACSRGLSAAIEGFHARFRPAIVRVLARRRASADVADDVIQTVFENLLVAPPRGSPKIAEYRGMGPLRAWVSTAAATTLLMIRRAAGRRREEAPDSGFFQGLAKNADPEMLLMKERYKTEMKEAIMHAMGRLSDRDRALLRLHLCESLSIDRLGAMYRVNRATAARWLAAARESILTSTRAELRARLHLSESECDSIVALVGTDLHLSIARRLS